MGITNLRKVQATLTREWPALIDKRSSEIQRRLAFLILGAVVEVDGALRHVSGLLQMTPVDTGRARGNWQVSTGTPILTAIDGVRAEGTVAGEAAAALSGLRPFGVVYIVNNLPYIVPLNNGHSPQAPAGWIEQAIANAQAQFETTR